MKTTLALLLIVGITFGSAGCGTPAHATAATQAPGFTAGSKIKDQGNGFFDIGAEFLAPAGFSKADLPFTLPANLTVAHFRATVSWNAPCQGDVLAVLFIDGQRFAPIILKTLNGAQTLMVNYDLPYPTGSGVASLHVEANPVCSGPYAHAYSSFEIQGSLVTQ